MISVTGFPLDAWGVFLSAMVLSFPVPCKADKDENRKWNSYKRLTLRCDAQEQHSAGEGELVVEDPVEEICLPVSFVLLADLVRKACGRSKTCTLRGESMCWHDRWWLFVILRS